jgi:hypothetical protein
MAAPWTTREVETVGSCGAVGGIIAVIADATQKREASAMVNMADALQATFGFWPLARSCLRLHWLQPASPLSMSRSSPILERVFAR